jgi:hypothetical protein
MTSRERFEASGITSLLSRSTEPGSADEYADSHTQFAWRTWKVAERATLERAMQALYDDKHYDAYETLYAMLKALPS